MKLAAKKKREKETRTGDHTGLQPPGELLPGGCSSPRRMYAGHQWAHQLPFEHRGLIACVTFDPFSLLLYVAAVRFKVSLSADSVLANLFAGSVVGREQPT